MGIPRQLLRRRRLSLAGTLIPSWTNTQFNLPTQQGSMSERNKLTMPIKLMNKFTTLMTMRSVLRAMNGDPIVRFPVNFYLIHFNIRDV